MVGHTVLLLAIVALRCQVPMWCVLLLSQAISCAYMEGLKCTSLVVCETFVSQPALGYECIGVFEHGGRMVHCPMRRCDSHLVRIISSDMPLK